MQQGPRAEDEPRFAIMLEIKAMLCWSEKLSWPHCLLIKISILAESHLCHHILLKQHNYFCFLNS